MKQTPIHHGFNHDILRILPKDLKRIVEVGSSSGALAREYRNINPACEYIGIEIDPKYAEASKNFCTEVILGNIENFGDEIFLKLFPSDCWILDIWRRIGTSLRSMGSAQPHKETFNKRVSDYRLHPKCATLEPPGKS